MDCTGCCSACKPPWIRHVDNIYPKKPQDGIMRNNMSKLTFYALSNPQKLDRIGDYLSKRLSRDLRRNSMQMVAISMEAMDSLLQACHSHALNLFVESFLRMVQKLLECADPDMQCLATTSFVKFSNIEEDTPSYHRRYDFFVSQYSAMCHSNHSTSKQRIRLAGLQGIQGVIRKTVSDELQPDIWEQHHMDKIVPSLLYNMHSEDPNAQPAAEGDINRFASPRQEAERVFRDLVCRAGYNNLKSVLKPVLSHMDSHDLWTSTNFPVECFKIIMYSVQAQHGHVVVHMLMSHLDANMRNSAELKARITDVLSETVIIAAGGSIGPSVLEVFNSLLRHLRLSVEYKSNLPSEVESNTRFQESIINTIGEFANHLPDFQKIEILMFVVSKMPTRSQSGGQDEQTNTLLQDILLKTILKVATTYRTVLMSNAFPASLKNPLLQLSLSTNPSTRLTVQKILHTLIDRHDNSEKFSTIWLPEDIAELDLTVEKPSRQDVHFMRHGGSHILWHILESLRLANSRENYVVIYRTICLLMVELLAEETYIDFANFALQLQDMASTATLPATNRRHIHIICICVCNLFGELTTFPEIVTHTADVVLRRKARYPYLLPDPHTTSADLSPTDNEMNLTDIDSTSLLDVKVFEESFKSHGLDVSALSRHITTPDNLEGLASSQESDTGSVNIELESAESSPDFRRRSFAPTESDSLTLEELRSVLRAQDDPQEAEARRKQIHKEFQTATLENIVKKAESRNELSARLFDMLANEGVSDEEEMQAAPINSIKYPPMFVY